MAIDNLKEISPIPVKRQNKKKTIIKNISKKSYENMKIKKSSSFNRIKNSKKSKFRHSDIFNIPNKLKKVFKKMNINYKFPLKPSIEPPSKNVNNKRKHNKLSLIKSSNFSYYMLKFPKNEDIIKNGDLLLSFCSNNLTGVKSISNLNDNVDECSGRIPGDVNNDGVVNILDIVSMISHIISPDKLEGCDFKSADLTGDGIVNVLDIIAIINIILSDHNRNNKNENGKKAREHKILNEILEKLQDNSKNKLSGYMKNKLLSNIYNILMTFIKKDTIYSIYWKNREKNIELNKERQVDSGEYHSINIMVNGYSSNNYFSRTYCTGKDKPSFAIFRKLSKNKFIMNSLNFNSIKKYSDKSINILEWNKIDNFKLKDLSNGRNKVITL